MKTLNFDKFVQEKNDEMIEVTVLGKTYRVKSRIPAIVPIMMARAESADDKQAATKAVLKAADVMFGKVNLDRMCEDGISAAELVDLVQRLFNLINGADDEDDEAEELTDEDSRKAVGGGNKAKK